MKAFSAFRCSIVVLCAVTTVVVSHAAAREAVQYPNKPIRVIVPGPPGGPTDVVARAVGEGLTKTLGQLVIDNRSGAAGEIGADIVAHSTPDGYTLMLTHQGPLTLVPLLAASPSYNPLENFTHISLVVSMPMLLIVNPNVPAKSVQELVALAKARPGKLNYASGGTGTGIHMGAELFKMVAGVNIVHVPYKGAAPGMTGLMGGEVDMMFNGLANSLSFIKTGRVRALGVASAQRTPLLPDLPTISESGLPYYYTGWYGLLGPLGMPGSIVAKISAALTQALNSEPIKERLRILGLDVINSTPEQFSVQLRAEIGKMAKIVTATGMKGK